MSGKTGIAWTNATWNPVVVCKRVSSGCDHCYAFDLHDKRHIAWKRGRWPSAPKQYHQPFSRVQILPERLEDPYHWRKPRRIFVNSMSDLFHDDVPGGFITNVFEVMRKTPQHTYQVLTKRPERMLDFCNTYYARSPETLPNVWLGVSVEDQAAADERIPLLFNTQATVRFLSCEPLLGALDLRGLLCTDYGRPLDWVIVGGESGRFARAMQWEWLESLVDQCQLADVPIFVKQLGSALARAVGSRDRHGGNPHDWPEWARVREFPRIGGG